MNHCFKLSLLLFVLAGCATDLRPNYEGLRCDPGNICPAGFDCISGVCRGKFNPDGGDACAGVSCTTPPASQCQDANTKRTFIAGSCDKSSGQCVWTSQDTTCAMGCQNGLCIGDPCNTVTCNSPPSPTCANGTTLRVSNNPGTCNNGSCTYGTTDTTCANGCDGGQCVGQNLCNGVTCNMPPAASCTGTNTRTSYTSPGTCNPGTGVCSYTAVQTNCPNGCSNGACVTAALTFTQLFPQVRHQVNAVDMGPASNGDRVLVVGNGGAISYFNGTSWARINNADTDDLNAVWFSGANTAWIVGRNRTVLRWNGLAGTPLSVVNNVPGSGSANFVSVHGTSDTNIVIADEAGGWYRFNGVSWTNGTLSSTNQPYAMRAVWVDPTGKTRIAGRCATSSASPKGCIAYNDPLSASNPNTWYEDLDGTTNTTSDGFLAVGPTPATVPSNEAWVGRFPTTAMRRHDGANGSYDDAGVPAVPQGNGIVGITGSAPSVARATYVLSGVSSTTASYLYRATATGLDTTPLFNFFFNAQWISRNDSGGVVVADARFPTSGMPNTPIANDIIRRGVVTNEALDLGEDWVGFDTNLFNIGGTAYQSYVTVSAFNDIAIRPTSGPASSRWVFRRGPFAESTDLVAANGVAVISARSGGLYRFTIAGGFTKVSLSPNTTNDLNAICRATDTEMYAVGNGGLIYSYNGSGAANAVTSPTAKNLFDVQCSNAAGNTTGVACGQDGTVLVYRNGNWQAVTPAFPSTTVQLTSCRQVGGAIYVAGDGVFARYESGTWTQLPTRTPLSDLVAVSPSDIYAASGATVVRFDGSAWSDRFTAPQVLRAGGQVGARVVYAGGAGVLVEGQ